MATAWVKSLQCKSSALDDVVYTPKPKKPLLPSAAACANSSQAIRDVVFLFPKQPHPSLPKKPPEKNLHNHHHQRPKRAKSKPKPNKPTIPPSPPAGPTAPPFPTLTELPAGHSSRRVVEIIFGSSWSDRGGAASRFPGQIEMLFRVHNPARTVACFEEYRSAVRSRSRSQAGDARCAADGNEMMRFHCAPSLSPSDGIYDASVVCCVGTASPSPSPSPSPAGIRTFAGSGGAHESAGGGPGRRAMLVCRVIAGRVRAGPRPGPSGESESICNGKGELVVFDPRALLPCFLIIYKI